MPEAYAHALTSWSFDASIDIGLALLLAAYFWLRRAAQAARGIDRQAGWRVLSFVAGAVLIALALQSPIDRLGDTYSFSWHMIQHSLLGMVAPPLLVVGLDRASVDLISRGRVTGPIVGILGSPASGLILFTLAWTVWHLPALYNATLESDGLHIFEHLSLIAAGVAFWWPVAWSEHLPDGGLRTPMARVAYLVAATIPMTAVSGVLMGRSSPDYPHYLEGARQLGFQDAAQDERVGGIVMLLVHLLDFGVAVGLILRRELLRAELEAEA